MYGIATFILFSGPAAQSVDNKVSHYVIPLYNWTKTRLYRLYLNSPYSKCLEAPGLGLGRVTITRHLGIDSYFSIPLSIGKA